jgi:hypothetical protein
VSYVVSYARIRSSGSGVLSFLCGPDVLLLRFEQARAYCDLVREFLDRLHSFAEGFGFFAFKPFFRALVIVGLHLVVNDAKRGLGLIEILPVIRPSRVCLEIKENRRQPH